MPRISASTSESATRAATSPSSPAARRRATQCSRSASVEIITPDVVRAALSAVTADPPRRKPATPPAPESGWDACSAPGYASSVVGRGDTADVLPHLIARVEGVLIQRWSVDGLEVRDELLMARRPEKDAADERAADDPPQRELDEREPGRLGHAAQALHRGELHRVPVAVPIH